MSNPNLITRRTNALPHPHKPLPKLSRPLSLALTVDAYYPYTNFRKKVASMARTQSPRQNDYPRPRTSYSWQPVFQGASKRSVPMSQESLRQQNILSRMKEFRQAVRGQQNAKNQHKNIKQRAVRKERKVAINLRDKIKAFSPKEQQLVPKGLLIELQRYKQLRSRLMQSVPGEEMRLQQDLVKQSNRLLLLRQSINNNTRPYLSDHLISPQPFEQPPSIKAHFAASYTLFEDYLLEGTTFDFDKALNNGSVQDQTVLMALKLVCQRDFGLIIRLFRESFVQRDGVYMVYLYLDLWIEMSVQADPTKLQGQIWPHLLESALLSRCPSHDLPTYLNMLLGTRYYTIPCQSSQLKRLLSTALHHKFLVLTSQKPFLHLQACKEIEDENEGLVDGLLVEGQFGVGGWRKLQQVARKYHQVVVVQHVPGSHLFSIEFLQNLHSDHLTIPVQQTTNLTIILQPITSHSRHYPVSLTVTLYQRSRPQFWLRRMQVEFKGIHVLHATLQPAMYRLTLNGGNSPYSVTLQSDQPMKQPVSSNRDIKSCTDKL